jgi:hypothetical protein
VQQVYPKDIFWSESMKMAEEIASYDPIVVQAAKRVTGVAMAYPAEVSFLLETTSSAFTMKSAKPGSGPFARK